MNSLYSDNWLNQLKLRSDLYALQVARIKKAITDEQAKVTDATSTDYNTESEAAVKWL